MRRAGEKNGSGQPDLRPKVRFPEFGEHGAWHTETISEVSEPIKEKVGDHRITPVSITAGVGFVPQADKFGRDISGEQYKNYTYLRRGDFAYNKGNSKSFPQGYVCQLHEFDEVAASSAFICFKLKDGYEPTFLKGLFDRNTHGRQLAAHITSGARSNGLLNLNAGQFYGVQLPFPPKFEEQERIAECLASIAALIEAESEKLDALKDHKQGLMQQLFPVVGEETPSLRLVATIDQGTWTSKPLGEIAENLSNLRVPVAASERRPGPYPYYGASGVVDFVDDYIFDDDLLCVSEDGANLVARTSPIAFAISGKTWVNNHAHVLKPHTPEIQKIIETYLNFVSLQDFLTGMAQPKLNKAKLESIPIPLPEDENEQVAFASVFSTVDEALLAQNETVDALKRHKQGLLQQLFPSLDEVQG
jgi:type I restriction enzyme S subunit